MASMISAIPYAQDFVEQLTNRQADALEPNKLEKENLPANYRALTHCDDDWPEITASDRLFGIASETYGVRDAGGGRWFDMPERQPRKALGIRGMITFMRRIPHVFS